MTKIYHKECTRRHFNNHQQNLHARYQFSTWASDPTKIIRKARSSGSGLNWVTSVEIPVSLQLLVGEHSPALFGPIRVSISGVESTLGIMMSENLENDS
jgi:hypothetical protein